MPPHELTVVLSCVLLVIAAMDVPSNPRRFDFTFNDSNGEPVSLSDERFSGKVVYVDIWSTSCPASRKEMPVLVDLFHKYHERGFETIGIAFGPHHRHSENRTEMNKIVEDLDIPFPFLYGGRTGEAQGALPQLEDYCDRWKHTEAYPTGVFIDCYGDVRAVKTGIDPNDKTDWFVSWVEELLNEVPHAEITLTNVPVGSFMSQTLSSNDDRLYARFK